MNRLLILSFLFLLYGVREAHSQRFTVMSWNVENLFDCRDDSLKDDGEFLPESERRWTLGRYWRKQDQLARTIAAVEPQNGWPLLVGLMEVENDSVVFDLARRSPLRRAGYDFLVTQSPDVRGIDVALLYQPSCFRLISHCSVRVPSAQNGFRPTRDILHATGTLPSGDTLHVLAVHLPSRAGNSRQSSRHRELAMSAICTLLDSLQGKKTVLMGDFNAEPSDPLLKMLADRMVSLMPQRKSDLRKAKGTYVYQGHWGYLDHIFVSPALLPQAKPQAEVAAFPFLTDKDGHPFRTYRGPYYAGGISDHFPVFVELEF